MKAKKERIIRLLNDISDSGFMQMAIDEALIKSVSFGGLPILRFYSWTPKCVSIGYFQSIEKEIDLKYAKFHNIDVVRRITGGGAVFHDAEITYSIILNKNFLKNGEDLLECYAEICNGIVLGLKEMGIDASFVPINDIVVNGKKISGNAQTRIGDVILQHGTILLSVNVDEMFSVLKVPDEKLKGKMIEAVKERVTSLSHLTGKTVFFENIKPFLVKGFKAALSCNFQEIKISDDELDCAKKINIEKYNTKEWNFKR